MGLRRDTPKSRAFQRRGQQSGARSLQDSSRRSVRESIELRKQKPEVPFNIFSERCQLARFDPDHPCEGPVVRCHLIQEQWLLNTLGLSMFDAWHEDFWIPGCNGLGTPHGGHHFRLDNGLLKIDREFLPARLERRAALDDRIEAKLEREYGALPKIGAAA